MLDDCKPKILTQGEIVATQPGIHHLLVDETLAIGARGLYQAVNTFRVVPEDDWKVLYVYGDSKYPLQRVKTSQGFDLSSEDLAELLNSSIPDLADYKAIVIVSCGLGEYFVKRLSISLAKQNLHPNVIGSKAKPTFYKVQRFPGTPLGFLCL